MVALEYLHNTKGLKCNFLEYKTIRRKLADMGIPEYNFYRERPSIHIMLEKISLGGKGCNRIYKSMQRNSDNVIRDAMQKWETILNVEISLQELTKSFYFVQKF